MSCIDRCGGLQGFFAGGASGRGVVLALAAGGFAFGVFFALACTTGFGGVFGGVGFRWHDGNGVGAWSLLL